MPSEDKIKLLTEYLDECFHIPTEYFTEDKIECGLVCTKCGKRGNFYDGELNQRTFTTGQDLYDLYRKIVEKGGWDDWEDYTEKIWLADKDETYQDLYQSAWLFHVDRIPLIWGWVDSGPGLFNCYVGEGA